MEPCKSVIDWSSLDIVNRPLDVIRQYDILREKLTKPQLYEFIFEHTSRENRTLTRTLLRYNQLYDIDYDTFGLKKIEKLRMAYFIEVRIFGKQRSSSKYFKKSCLVAYSLVHDVFQKCIYILTKKEIDFGIDDHSKKIKFAIQVPNDLSIQPNTVMRVVNKTPRVNYCSNRRISAEASNTLYINYRKMEVELGIHQKFSNNKGVWSLLGSCKYKQPCPENLILKVTGFMPMASLSLSMAVKNRIKLSFNMYVGIARDLASALHHLHDHGYIHGGIRQEHVVYTILPDYTAVAGFIDFRDCLQTKGCPLSFPVSEGYYGFADATAPELFGNKEFKRSLFCVDIWAFGYLLYMFFFKNAPPWTQIVCRTKRKIWAQVDAKTKTLMFDSIMSAIEQPRKLLLEKEERSSSDEFMLLIYDMMRFNPAQRLNTRAVIDRLASINF